jgi:hypothetical protein
MSSLFAVASAIGWAAVVATALLFRGRFFGTFVAILLGIHTLISIAMLSAFARIWPLYVAVQAVVFVHFCALARPRMRPRL